MSGTSQLRLNKKPLSPNNCHRLLEQWAIWSRISSIGTGYKAKALVFGDIGSNQANLWISGQIGVCIDSIVCGLPSVHKRVLKRFYLYGEPEEEDRIDRGIRAFIEAYDKTEKKAGDFIAFD